MIIVLDASAAIEIALNRSKSKHFRTYLSNCQKVITSDLYKAEITNVFWKYVKARLISREVGGSLLDLSLNLIDEYYDISQYSTEAYYESLRLDHSSYDMFYFTLARRTGGKLLTLDKKLKLIAEKEGIGFIE